MSKENHDFSVEDNEETQQAIGEAANNEFRRLIERLKKESKKDEQDQDPKTTN